MQYIAVVFKNTELINYVLNRMSIYKYEFEKKTTPKLKITQKFKFKTRIVLFHGKKLVLVQFPNLLRFLNVTVRFSDV